MELVPILLTLFIKTTVLNQKISKHIEMLDLLNIDLTERNNDITSLKEDILKRSNYEQELKNSLIERMICFLI